MTRIALAWLALVVLMFASLGSAYLPLGAWNLALGLLVASAKSLIVLWLFMGLARAPATLRLAAGLGFGALALLFTLSGVDFTTRSMQPAPVQQPMQVHLHEHGTSQGGSR